MLQLNNSLNTFQGRRSGPDKQ